MARASVTTQKIVQTGLTPALTQPTADGDVVDTGAVFLMVTATSNAVDVTVQTPVEVDGLDVEELVVNVGTSTTKLIGPLPKRTYGRPSTDPAADVGRAYVNYSTQTGVTRAVVSF